MKKQILTPLFLFLLASHRENLSSQAVATEEQSSLPPVHVAAITGNMALLNAFIRKGIPFDTRDERGVTPLFCALAYGKLTIARQLLYFGASKSTYQGCKLNASPLHAMIIEHVDQSVAKRMLNSGLLEEYLNHRAARGFTPLMCAAYIGGDTSLEIAKELLRRGAHRYAQDDFKQNALTIALHKGNIGIAIEIARDWNPFHDKPHELTPAHYLVIVNPPPEQAHVFLSCITPDAIAMHNIHLQTPLFAALAHGKTELASQLIEHGAFFELRDICNATPLHAIICFSQNTAHLEKTLKWLNKHNLFLINAPTKTGEIPIALANRIPHKKTRDQIIRLLIDYAARSQQST